MVRRPHNWETTESRISRTLIQRNRSLFFRPELVVLVSIFTRQILSSFSIQIGTLKLIFRQLQELTESAKKEMSSCTVLSQRTQLRRKSLKRLPGNWKSTTLLCKEVNSTLPTTTTSSAKTRCFKWSSMVINKLLEPVKTKMKIFKPTLIKLSKIHLKRQKSLKINWTLLRTNTTSTMFLGNSLVRMILAVKSLSILWMGKRSRRSRSNKQRTNLMKS